MCCKTCRKPIEPARIALNLTNCFACASLYTRPRRGIMNWDHKTAPEIEILTEGEYSNRRRYDPANRRW